MENSYDNLFDQIYNKKRDNDGLYKLNKLSLANDEDDVGMQHCSECNSIKIVELEGKYVCMDCGISNGIVIDFKQEWRFYGSDDNKNNDPSRCGMPTNELLPNSSIGSVIGFGSNESYVQRRIRNMQYWNAIPYKESSLLEAFNNITTMCQNAGLSHCIIEEAKYMYKKVSELKSSRRTKKEAMKAASVYVACKIKNVPRNTKEIAKIFNIKDIKIMNKAVKRFNEIWNSINDKEKLNSNIIEDKESETNDLVQNSLKYLHRHCSKLDINDNIYNMCYKLLEYIENTKILNIHNPSSRIATCLYYIVQKYKLDVNIYNIEKECNVSNVTIIKCYNKLMKIDNILNEYLS
jgi:transcription initiation factor TFIIB